MPPSAVLWIGRVLICSGILAAVIAIPQFMLQMRQALQESRAIGMDERLTNVQAEGSSWLAEQDGGRWGRYGWYLAPHEAGRVRIRLPASEPGVLKMRIWTFPAGRTDARITDGADSYEILPAHLDGRIFEVNVNGPSELMLSATNETSDEKLVLDRFAVTWFSANDHLPAIWPLASALALCLIGWGGVSWLSFPDRKWTVWFGCSVILVAVFVGFGQRWLLLDMARSLPVDPDVVGYVDSAIKVEWFTPGRGFYSGSFSEREPLHVGGLNLWFSIWGNTTASARWYSMVLSTALIGACGGFVWKVSDNPLLGSAAALIVALHPVWVEESVRGLRLESMSLLTLAALSVWLWMQGWFGAILLGVVTGVMTLLQTPALSIVLPLVWLCWLVNCWQASRGAPLLMPSQWRWPQLSLASFLAVTLFLPHLYGLYKVHGDPSWPSYGYARWNANFEFPERLGTPGFPSAGEFEQSRYAGPRLTYREYLFGLHSLPTLIRGQMKGWIESTVYMSASLTPDLNSLIFLFQASGLRAAMQNLTPWMAIIFGVSLIATLWGWIGLLRDVRYWWIPFLSLWGTWYVAYLYSARLVEPFRHTGHVYSLLLFCLLWGCLLMGQWGRRAFEARRQEGE